MEPVKDPLRRFPTVHEIYPDDSISMYKPYRPPPSIRSRRQGGTDVDGADAGMYADEGYMQPHHDPSTFSGDAVTMNTPISPSYLEPTAAPTSAWGTAL